MPKRKRAARSRSDSTSSNEIQRANDARGRGIFDGIVMCIINIHLDSARVGELTQLAESGGAQFWPNPDQAEIVITEIGTRKRLERHIRWEQAQARNVVSVEWLVDSAKADRLLPFGEAEGENYWAIPGLPPRWPVEYFIEREKHRQRHRPSGSKGSPIVLSEDEGEISESSLKSRFCIRRKAPLVCPNQELAGQLAIIKKSRDFEEGKEVNALAYARAIATIKAYPRRIRSVEEIAKMPYVGPKIQTAISQYLKDGYCHEARNLQNNVFYNTMKLFTSVYGIGPTTGRILYARGMRTLDDLKDHYRREIEAGGKSQEKNEGVLTALELHEELTTSISREEVEEIARLIKRELDGIMLGCIYTITGGYRRGKPESNDIDIVFSHPLHGKGRGTLEKLINRLQRRGLITHLLPTGSFRTSPTKAYTQDEAVERALTVFALGQDSPSFANNPAGQPRKHRRLDLLFAPIETYWCTVVGWTGSVMFERDLRRYCEEMEPVKYKFDSSGLTRRHDSARIVVKSEEHLFEILGLPFIAPKFRNHDY